MSFQIGVIPQNGTTLTFRRRNELKSFRSCRFRRTYQVRRADEFSEKLLSTISLHSHLFVSVDHLVVSHVFQAYDQIRQQVKADANVMPRSQFVWRINSVRQYTSPKIPVSRKLLIMNGLCDSQASRLS